MNTENVNNEKTRFKKFIKWVLFRFPLFLVIIFIVMIGALKLVERYPVPLSQGFEEYLSKATGTNATIGKLEKIQFFPNFDVNLKDITMHDYDNAAIVGFNADEIKISAPFLTMLFSGRKVNAIDVSNLSAQAGLITPLDIKIEKMNILDRDGPQQYGSFLVANGTYNAKDMYLEAELEKSGETYKVSSLIPFSIKVGGSEINAELDKGFTEVWLRNAVFSKDGKNAEAKDYLLVKSRQYNKDNPLMCVFNNGDASACDEYLK